MRGRNNFYNQLVLLVTLIFLVAFQNVHAAKVEIKIDKKTKQELQRTIKNATEYAILLHPVVTKITSEMKAEIINNIPKNVDHCKCLLTKPEADELAALRRTPAAKIYNGMMRGDYIPLFSPIVKAQARLAELIKKSEVWANDETLLKQFERRRKEIVAADKDKSAKITAFGITDTQEVVSEKVADNWPENHEQLIEKFILILAEGSLTYSEIMPGLTTKEYFELAAHNFFETYDNSLFDVPIGDLLVAVIMKSTLTTFDPHSTFMTSVESADFVTMTTHYKPVGMKFLTHPKGSYITELMPNSPAIANGLKKGDIVTEINGIDLTKLDASEANIQVRRFAAEQFLTLKFIRDGQSLSVKLDKEKVANFVELTDIDPIQVKIKVVNGKKIGILAFPMFFSGSAEIVKEKLEKIADKIDGLIIDLRFNGGGSLNDVTKIAYLFQDMDQNTVWFAQNPKDFGAGLPVATSMSFDSGNDSDFAQVVDKPIVVLVNNGSASASELLAGTLKIHGKALVVGSKHTYGKGSVQQLANRFWFDDPDTSFTIRGALKLTNDMYFLSDGSSPQFTGIESDIEIKGSYENEEQLEKLKPHAIPPVKAPENPFETLFFPKKLAANKDFLKSLSEQRQVAWGDENDRTKNEERVLGEAENILVDWINHADKREFVSN